MIRQYVKFLQATNESKGEEIEEIRTNALFCLNILVNRDIESYIKSKVWT